MSQSPVLSTPMPQKWLASIHKYLNKEVKYSTAVAQCETPATPGLLEDEENLSCCKEARSSTGRGELHTL